MNRRCEQADVMRGLLILLMIMGHIKFGTAFDKYIHMFHMPAWFLLSGWFYHVREESFPGYVLRKARKLLVPYFLCGLVHYPLWILLVRENGDNVRTPIKSLLWINTDNHLPIANALWFLTCLFLAELFFEALRRILPEERKLYIGCGALFLAGSVFLPMASFRLPWAADTALTGCGLIAAGYWASNHRDDIPVRRILHLSKRMWLIGVIVNAALCFVNGAINLRKAQYGFVPLTLLNLLTASILLWNLGGYLVSAMQKTGADSFYQRMTNRIMTVGRYSIVYLCWNQLAITISKLLLKGTVLEKLPKLPVRLLILLITLFLLYGAERIYAGYREKKTQKHDVQEKSAAKRDILMTVCYLLVLTTCICACLYLKRQEKQRIYAGIVVSSPVIPEDRSLNGYANADKLMEVLYDNVNYLADEQWNTPSYYAYCPSSNFLRAKTPNRLWAFLIRQSQKSFQQWETGRKLYVVNSKEGMSREQAIRPWAHTCFVMANAIRFGIAEDRKDELERKACLLIEALAEAHLTNTRTGWGNSWQSAEWAENIGYAGWLLWDRLSTEGRLHVYQMVKYEADRFLDYDIPYYRDRDGIIVYEGDTKAEENAWNSRILALAVCMFPEEEHASRWEKSLEKLLIASGAVPSDVTSDKSVDGYVLSKILNGSNINEDGTVVNHKRIHVDYMATTMEGMLDTAIIYSLAGKNIPAACTFGFERMYNALVNVDLGIYDSEKAGHHFYERENGRVTGAVNMPGENDWGGRWYPEYYLVDTAVDLFGLDGSLDENLKAKNWADIHLQVLAEMSSREGKEKKKGQFFTEGENNFISGETYQMHNLSKAYLLRVFNSDMR